MMKRVKLQHGLERSRIQELFESFDAKGSCRPLKRSNVDPRLEVALAARLSWSRSDGRRDLGSYARARVGHQKLLLHQAEHHI